MGWGARVVGAGCTVLLALECVPRVRECSEGCVNGAVCDERLQVCVYPRDGGAAGTGGSSGSGGAGGGAECGPADRRPCDGGCRNVQACVNGAWGACVSACDAGQECVSDSCRCTPTSCNGCCEGDACRTGTADDACGSSGFACAVCPAGQGCDGGACEGCNALSCASGCCTGSTCSAPTFLRCGAAGAVCRACDSARANVCDGGACGCGSGVACEPGQHCVDGGCVCNAASCDGGCCSGSSCVARSAAACGPSADTCSPCNAVRVRADRCSSDGGCVCGPSEYVCGAAQRCQPLNGLCFCDSSICSDGCCDRDHCANRFPACGTPGFCSICSQQSDRCDGGACACGLGAPCNPILATHCADGGCRCGDSPACSGAGCLPSGVERCLFSGPPLNRWACGCG